MSFHLRQLSIPYIDPKDSDIWAKDLVFAPASTYHIKARSGKGKSSLIHTLYGIQATYKGRVDFNGRDLAKLEHDAWCALRTGELSIVFQDLKLFEENTALENIEIKRVSGNFYPEQKIYECAELLNVQHTLNRNINTLSYGERQRIAIIRALMQPFETLLLDEPFSHLDQENISKAAALLRQEQLGRKATLIVCDLETDRHFEYDHELFL